MTKDKALQAWFEQFMTAYPTSSVPEDAVFPWLTYELTTGSWGDGDIAMAVNLWFYTENEAIPNAKAQEISDAIGMGGVFVHYDGGAMLLKRGSPWCQSIKDDSDKNIKRRYINILVEYLSQD
jgi:hypothetical protein